MSDSAIKELNFKLKQLEDEYIIKKNLKLFCGTYNLKGKLIDESLEPWLCFHENSDIYILGFQELCELSTTSFIMQSDWIEREQLLIQEITHTFHSKGKLNIKMLKSCRLWGIFIVVYVKQELESSIRDVGVGSVATGILNTLGNKGTVAISLRLYETRLCFLCSHFASDTDQLERRNADYRYTIQNLRFPSEIATDPFDLDSHQIIVWCGDFNYRLDNLSLDETLEAINSNAFDKLVDYDQLKKQLQFKRAFQEFQEGQIKFKPTYKFLVKEDRYDVVTNSSGQATIAGSGSSKLKLPSWTDRVLYKLNDETGSNITLSQYSAINMLTISDHKPVYALFNIECKKIDEVAQKRVYDRLIKESDRKQNEERPHISLLSRVPELNFGTLTFYQTKCLSFEIENDGRTVANVDNEIHINEPRLNEDEISFINNHFSRDLSINSASLAVLFHHWFKIKPHRKDRLIPGQTFKFDVCTDFSQTNILRLNRLQHLDDFVIVKCINGNDVFVNVVCDYKPTLIGISLKALSLLDENSSFNSYDTKHVKDIEQQIMKIEESLDKAVYAEIHRLRMQRANASGIVQLREFAKSIRTLVKEKDIHYTAKLCKEYEHYLEYLIDRASKLKEVESGADVVLLPSQLTIEEQKDLILNSLSECKYDVFTHNQFDFDVLVEILCDLLNCLPIALIPRRYLELCQSVVNNYTDCLEILNFLPSSHRQLFNLIVKFVYIYVKTNAINYDSIAKAIFQLDTQLVLKNASNTNSYRNTTQFLKVFIDEYDKKGSIEDELDD